MGWIMNFKNKSQSYKSRLDIAQVPWYIEILFSSDFSVVSQWSSVEISIIKEKADTFPVSQ